VEKAMKNRNMDMNLDEFVTLEKQRREILQQVETLKSERNSVSQEISKMKKSGENADDKILAMRALGEKISEDDKELKEIEQKLKDILLTIPNMPADDVPVGKDDSDNPIVRKWSEPTKFSLCLKHTGILAKVWAFLILKRAAKVTGARFTFYKVVRFPPGACSYNIMLDDHTQEQG
jgi:seryl-tRNA synthetase